MPSKSVAWKKTTTNETGASHTLTLDCRKKVLKIDHDPFGSAPGARERCKGHCSTPEAWLDGNMCTNVAEAAMSDDDWVFGSLLWLISARTRDTDPDGDI